MAAKLLRRMLSIRKLILADLEKCHNNIDNFLVETDRCTLAWTVRKLAIKKADYEAQHKYIPIYSEVPSTWDAHHNEYMDKFCACLTTLDRRLEQLGSKSMSYNIPIEDSQHGYYNLPKRVDILRANEEAARLSGNDVIPLQHDQANVSTVAVQGNNVHPSPLISAATSKNLKVDKDSSLDTTLDKQAINPNSLVKQISLQGVPISGNVAHRPAKIESCKAGKKNSSEPTGTVLLPVPTGSKERIHQIPQQSASATADDALPSDVRELHEFGRTNSDDAQQNLNSATDAYDLALSPSTWDFSSCLPKGNEDERSQASEAPINNLSLPGNSHKCLQISVEHMKKRVNHRSAPVNQGNEASQKSATYVFRPSVQSKCVDAPLFTVNALLNIHGPMDKIVLLGSLKSKKNGTGFVIKYYQVWSRRKKK